MIEEPNQQNKAAADDESLSKIQHQNSILEQTDYSISGN